MKEASTININDVPTLNITQRLDCTTLEFNVYSNTNQMTQNVYICNIFHDAISCRNDLNSYLSLELWINYIDYEWMRFPLNILKKLSISLLLIFITMTQNTLNRILLSCVSVQKQIQIIQLGIIMLEYMRTLSLRYIVTSRH